MKRWERTKEGWQCSDRWKRKLKDGSEVFAALFICGGRDNWAMELRFKMTEKGQEIGQIADEIIEVLDRREMPWPEGALSWDGWEEVEVEDVA